MELERFGDLVSEQVDIVPAGCGCCVVWAGSSRRSDAHPVNSFQLGHDERQERMMQFDR